MNEQWRASRYSGNGANCVEARQLRRRVQARDSKDPNRGILEFDASQWAQFIAGIRQR